MDIGSGLTRNQFFIWLGQEASPELPLFNELTVFVVDGPIDRYRFNQAVQGVVNDTDALRTVIRRVKGLPQAEVLDRLDCPTSYIDLSAEIDPADALDLWARDHVDSLIDLSRRSFESTLIKLSERRYAWALLQHHILSDATSMTITFQRVGDAYAWLEAGSGGELAQFPRYADYVKHEADYRQSARYRDCETYWQSKTDRPPDPVTFYGGRAWTPGLGERRQRLDIELGAVRSEAIRKLARSEGIRFLSEDLSIFSIFAAALCAYLYCLSGQRTLAFGVPWQNRSRMSRETVGLLMEQDPFVVSVDEGDTFESLIAKVRAEAIDAMRHLPYAAGNPGGRAYDVTLNYTKVSIGKFAGLEVQPSWYRPSYGTGSMGLIVHDFGHSGAFSLSFEFNDDLFAPHYRDAAASHFMKCLSALVEDRTRQVRSVNLLTDAERGLLDEWNATERKYPREGTIVELFEAQAARRPSAIAARCGESELSYATLARRAATVARRLRALDVGPGVLVGICMERSLDMLAGLLGILKAGGGYVPLDPAFPSDRRTFMLSDSGARILLTETRLLGTLDHDERQIVCLDALLADDAEIPDADGSAVNASDEIRAGPDDPAYVLYTSGSTGKPKGVEVPHRALTNFLCAMQVEPGCTEDDVLLAVTTLSFDIAGLELFLPLISGGQVDVASRSMAADGRLLKARLETGGATVLQATPATWRMLLDAGWSGTPGLKALIGGEALPADLVQPLLERTASLWNMYGPTETTIWSSVQQVKASSEEITIGTPIANTTFYILDARLLPVPIGVAGELYIGGDGLARGYHGRPELTEERFVRDPFSAKPGARMYRTGDLARFRPDGKVVHLGRLDHQVKIRGFRIELGEIESVLSTYPGVRQSVVVAHSGQAGQKQLIAYIVADPESNTDPSTLRHHLHQTLPDYMVPSQFLRLDQLPLTPNGKIDRNSLPEPDAAETSRTDLVAPRNLLESRVAKQFANALGMQEVSIDGDFFDLGGDSLLALRLIMSIEEEFGCQLPLQILYEASTVEELSQVVGNLIEATSPAVIQVDGDDNSGGGPRTDTEQKLFKIWTSILGAESVSRVDSFIELQGSRDLVPQLLTEVRSQFGVLAEGISAVEFATDPTIVGLARLVKINAPATPSLVVPLQPKGDGRPVFLIHAGGGYVFFYRALAARLGPDRPVYGVRARTRSDGRGLPFERSSSVEELAALYIDEIKTIQPQGPYTIGGACFGGVIAFEMAQQLLAKGESIASPVLLFDAFADPPGASVDPIAGTSEPRTLLGRVAMRLDPERSPNDKATIGYVIGKAISQPRAMATMAMALPRAAARRLKSNRLARELYWLVKAFQLRWATLEVAELKAMEQRLEVTFRLLKKYHPTPFPGSAALFKAEVGDDPESRWRALFLGGLDSHTLPGLHLDMMEEPAVISTAALVARHLDPDVAGEQRSDRTESPARETELDGWDEGYRIRKRHG